MTIEEFMRDIAPKMRRAGWLWIKMEIGAGSLESLIYQRREKF